MATTNLTFPSRAAHREWLATQAVLPRGFRAGTTRLDFTPREVGKPAAMNLTLLALDRPTEDFAAVFTQLGRNPWQAKRFVDFFFGGTKDFA